MSQGSPSSAKRLTNMVLAGAVARVADLVWIRLRSANLRVEAAEIDNLPERLTFNTSLRHAHRKVNGGLLDVHVEYRLDVLNDEAGSSREALVEAEYQLRYVLPSDFSPSAAELRWFAELNGTLNSWPYWRELAQTVLGRAGMGSLTLPLWRPESVVVDESGVPVVASQ